MASVYFNTTTDNLYTTSNLFTSTTSYTVMGWAKWATTEASDRYLFEIHNASNQPVHAVTRPSNGQFYASCDLLTNFTNGQTPTYTSWFCWALVVSAAGAGGARLRIRADGAGSWTDCGTTTVTDIGAGQTRIIIGDFGSQTALAYQRYVRMWNGTLSESELSLEYARTTPVKTTGLLRDLRLNGATNAATDSYNGYNMSVTGTFGTDGDDPVTPTDGASAVAKIKLMTHPSAASAASVEGWVLNSSLNAVLGHFSGKAFETSTESGQAVLKVSQGAFGVSTLTSGDTIYAVAQNSLFTTGLISGTVIEEE